MIAVNPPIAAPIIEAIGKLIHLPSEIFGSPNKYVVTTAVINIAGIPVINQPNLYLEFFIK